jgi:ubiquinone/menaquinone biosynthesis C-methylase UbiE
MKRWVMSEKENRSENWAAGDAYEPYVGRWSRLVARELLRWLALPPGSAWLDVGCGTGALSQTILEFASPGSVKGIDQSHGYINYARSRVQDGEVSFEIGDAMALSFEPDTFDATVSGLVLNFLPDPQLPERDQHR